jgi:hypothetical protein
MALVRRKTILLAFVLGRTSDWASKDGPYDYQKKSYSLVDLFDTDRADHWAVGTLEWLQRYAPFTPSHLFVPLSALSATIPLMTTKTSP